jgi:hypothetical protein
MPVKRKLPLASAARHDEYRAARFDKYYGKGDAQVKIDVKAQRVYLKDGAQCYTEIFGSRERAVGAYVRLCGYVKNGRAE